MWNTIIIVSSLVVLFFVSVLVHEIRAAQRKKKEYKAVQDSIDARRRIAALNRCKGIK